MLKKIVNRFFAKTVRMIALTVILISIYSILIGLELDNSVMKKYKFVEINDFKQNNILNDSITDRNIRGTPLKTRRLDNEIFRRMNTSWVFTTTKASLELVQYFNDPKYFCSELNSSEMLIVVHSSIGHKEQRKALRDTIGKHRQSFKVNYTLMFVVGSVGNVRAQEHIFEEYDKHRDLLLMKTPDLYNFLSYKALGWLKFLTLDCPKFKYVLKIDDDTLVNFDVLTDEIKKCEINNTTSGICANVSCCLWTDARVYRSDKIKVSFAQYNKTHWPHMCPGVAYILPQRIITGLWEAAKTAPFVWLDDVYVTAFLRQTANEGIFPLNKYYLGNFDANYNNIKVQRKIIGHVFNHDDFLVVYSKYWKIINGL
ncbi:Uncharacterised protein r2_g1202 [Pycnogonum litorale]